MIKLFTAVFNMSITAGCTAIAVITIRFLIRKAPKIFSYVLWLAVLIRLIFPFSFSSAISLLGLFKPNIDVSSGAIRYISYNAISSNTSAQKISNISNTTSLHTKNIISTNLISIASIIWVVFAAIFLLYSIISYIKIMQKVKTATLIKDNIFETDRISTPFLLGFIKPRIYVPLNLSKEELYYVTAHENVHIQRLDYLIKPFAFLVLIVHWFNPIIWLSFALMSKDMEMSCDESVVKSMGSDVRKSYSSSLLSLSIKRSGFAFSPIFFGESNVKSRIKNILNYKKLPFWGVICAIALVVLLIFALTSNPKLIKTSSTYLGYSIDTLMDNKTKYVGNNSKVINLVYAMPVPKGTKRGIIELQTSSKPYGVIIHLKSNSGIKDLKLQNTLYKNSVIMFGLIDNADMITYRIDYGKSSQDFTYTRNQTGSILNKKITSKSDLKKFIKELNKTSDIQKYINMVTPSKTIPPQLH